MQTKTYNVYKFNELTLDQKEKAIDNLRDINIDHDWWAFTYEDAATIGLRITGFDFDRNRHAKGEFNCLGGAEQCANLIIKEHGESTTTYKTAQNYLKELKTLEAQYPNREDSDHNDYELFFEANGLLSDDFLSSLLEDYSIMLQKEYEYLSTDAAIIETIEANDYDFTSEGKID